MDAEKVRWAKDIYFLVCIWKTQAYTPLHVLLVGSGTSPLLTCGSRAGHFSVTATVLGCIVRLQDTSLTLVGLREGIATLLAHALDLPYLSDCLLELLHPTRAVSIMVIRI